MLLTILFLCAVKKTIFKPAEEDLEQNNKVTFLHGSSWKAAVVPNSIYSSVLQKSSIKERQKMLSQGLDVPDAILKSCISSTARQLQ